MTPTERARRAAALYHDTSGGVGRAFLCERVAWLESELEGARGRDRPVTPKIVSDGTTGCCRCGACGRPTDPWDAWCRWCGQRQDETRWTRGD